MTILIPDTSSLINLGEVYIGRTHILEILNNLFDVQVSTEIPVEIRRHKQRIMSHQAEFLRFARQARRRFYRQQDYEAILLSHFVPSGNPERNRGERLNCALALYQVRRRETGQIIMLVDDQRAQRGLINWYEDRYKTTKTWNSLDLLLHIYFVTHPKWPLSQVELTLRSVNAGMEGRPDVAMNRLLDYRICLRDLHTMLRRMPKIRGVQ